MRTGGVREGRLRRGRISSSALGALGSSERKIGPDILETRDQSRAAGVGPRASQVKALSGAGARFRERGGLADKGVCFLPHR